MTPCETNIAECPIFRTMSPEERSQILQIAETRFFARGRAIIREEEMAPQGLWLIRAGRCEVVHQLLHDGEQQLAVLPAGAIFGEMSFFDPGPHSATVRSLEDVELMFIPADRFLQVQAVDLLAAEKFLKNMGRLMAQKLRRMDYFTLDLIPMFPAVVPSDRAPSK
ncbi:MAG: cyclic nucleotide-binding domain-containing protein [Planctomycetaceae bacterium]|nr:cyclic nucleotide-binding domain-containing protein [Planctomycetaceae bacterium]